MFTSSMFVCFTVNYFENKNDWKVLKLIYVPLFVHVCVCLPVHTLAL